MLKITKNYPLNITFNQNIFNLFINDLFGKQDVTVKGLSLDSKVYEILLKIAKNLDKSDKFKLD